MPLRVEPVRDRKLHRLIKAAPQRSPRKGEPLFRAGEPAAGVYFVQHGHVCLTAGAGPARRTAAVAGSHELFGEEAMIPGALRRYSALAGERSVLVVLDGPSVRGVLHSAPHTLAAYLEVKERDLDTLRRLATGSPGANARARLAWVVLDLMDRLGEPEGDRVWLGPRLTHRELADLAGVHRSTVTTCLNDWIWRGVLVARGRALGLTPDGRARLRALVAGE